MSYCRGVDLSDAQGPIDYAALAASGVDFTIHKCGNGNDAPDPVFAAGVAAARAAGLVVGAYHVGFPLPPSAEHPGREPEAQAEAHYEQSGGLGTADGDIPPALDLEWPVPGSAAWLKYGCSPASVRDWTLAYLERMRALCGKAPVLYDGFPDYWAGIGGEVEPRFAGYPAWVADYPAAFTRRAPVDDYLLVVPRPWSSWAIWQYVGGDSKAGRGVLLPSLGGVQFADGDVFRGSRDDLLAFCSLRSPAFSSP